MTQVVGTDQTPTSIVLDPGAAAVDREELDLNFGPIRVGPDGPDWGDAEIAAYMAQAARGEIPVDFRMPNRKITLPLLLGADGPDDFNAARLQLQAKTGLFQREGGWIQRGDGLYADIVNASLKLPDKHGYLGIEADVVLTLEALPEFYGDEIALDLITQTVDAEIAAVLEEDGEQAVIKGDYPARVRIEVNELDGEPQLGLIWGVRCRHYDAAETAQLAYDAEELDPLDSAATASISGASGGTVVRHQNLPTSWTPVLSTDLLGSAGPVPLTHKGTYRAWCRAYSTADDDVQLRLLYDVGDFTLPEENAPVRLPAAASEFHALDLGEVRLDEVPVGAHRWQGVIQAKGDVGGENVSIDRVWLAPVGEGYGVLRCLPSPERGLASLSARDEFNQPAGALSGKTLPVGGAWSTSGDADDFSVETTGKTAQRTAVSDTGGAGRFAIADSPNLAAVIAQVDFKHSAAIEGAGNLITGAGLVVRRVDANNFARLRAFIPPAGQAASFPDNFHYEHCIAGVFPKAGIAKATVPLSTDTWYTMRLLIDTAGRVFAWLGPRDAAPGSPQLQGQSAPLATGGVLASGGVGFYDERSVASASTRNYDNFAAWVPTPDAVVFANRSAELCTEGTYRETADGTGWGPTIPPIGDLPRLPPSGMEERPVELFLKLSRGDLDRLPDSGIDDLSARAHYRPSWVAPFDA